MYVKACMIVDRCTPKVHPRAPWVSMFMFCLYYKMQTDFFTAYTFFFLNAKASYSYICTENEKNALKLYTHTHTQKQVLRSWCVCGSGCVH